MKLGTSSGYFESQIEKYPLYEILKNDDLTRNLRDDELKFYFVLDRYVYTKVDDETNESKIEFDTGHYLKKYDLIFSRDEFQYINEFALRTFSFHTLILGELLPFIAIGITKETKAKIPLIKFTSNDDFRLFRVKEKWNYLENDLELLEKNIKQNSSFQKALIWFTLAKLSNTRIETFMNYYRCLEEFSRDFYKQIGKKFDDFVESEIPRFDYKIRKKIINFHQPNSNYLEAFLMLNNIEHGIISKIKDFRNKQIAHGNDYKVEYNMDLIKIIEEMEIFIQEIINQRIKKMKIKGLKNPDFLYYYYITISPSQRKIVLSDDYDFAYLDEELSAGGSTSYALGRIAEEDISSSPSSFILKIKQITENENICDILIKNFGRIIEY